MSRIQSVFSRSGCGFGVGKRVKAKTREVVVTNRKHHISSLPKFSTLLSGRSPRDSFGFQSDLLQIWYNNTERPWKDAEPHAHTDSDECFIVLKGRLIIEVEGERLTVGPGEFCCFPIGVVHCVVEVETPAETFMIRAPSIEDKLTFPV